MQIVQFGALAWSPGTSEDPQSAICAVLFSCVTSWLADDPRDGRGGIDAFAGVSVLGAP